MHQVKPESMEEYLQQTGEQLVQVSEDSEVPVKLLGSWITIIGTQLDQASKGTTQTCAFHSRLAALEKNARQHLEWEFLVQGCYTHVYTRTSTHAHTHTHTSLPPSPTSYHQLTSGSTQDLTKLKKQQLN